MTSTIAPSFATVYSRKADVSHEWAEVADPEFEAGDVVEAFFDLTFYPLEATFTGVSITDNSGVPIYWDRARVLRVLGKDGHDLVSRLEAWETYLAMDEYRGEAQ
jgi:hypothetical protein